MSTQRVAPAICGKAPNRAALQHQTNWFAVLLLLCLVVGCRSSRPSQDQAHVQIQKITDAIVSLRKAEPNLRGFQDVEAIASKAFAQRSAEDSDLLIGRLYYESFQRLTAHQVAAPPLDEYRLQAGVRRALTEPLASTRLGREYFDNLLSDTKARARDNREFQLQMVDFSGRAKFAWSNEWDSYRCLVDGIPMTSFTCRTLVVHDLVETLEVIPPRR